MHTLLIIIALCALIIFVPQVRRFVATGPLFSFLRRRVRPISDIERQALEAGDAGFEAGFFRGRPDWGRLRSLPPVRLTADEQAFLDGPANELCRLVDDWSIRYERRKIPADVWEYARQNGFLGLRVPKSRGGPEFSFQAQSIILGKMASRSLDVSTIVEVPNSLGPDELIERYGTEEQKAHYLPRFAKGQEIPSFAVTSVGGGSDAASMRDIGVVGYGVHGGARVLGIRLTWDKRYITFAPVATLIALTFHLFDPEGVLGRGKDVGITMALVPARHPGVVIGRRHLPSGAAFPNGPTSGTDVFIPLDWVVGGAAGAGQGWKMIMESLFVGRAISLPSMSVATTKMMLRYSAAYARVRKQFGASIGSFEGIEEPLARIAEMSYLGESARALTASLVDAGERSIAIAALMKYQTTEYARRSINDAIDIHGGRGIMDGPSNYLLSAYQMAPIGVTVEGANIVTRSLITFAQGALRSHPYLYKEIGALTGPDASAGRRGFDRAVAGHVRLIASNAFRSLFHGLSGGAFGRAPAGVPKGVALWYRALWLESCRFAFVADAATLLLGGRLKKKQKIGGRLADALSELYFASAALKRFEDDGFPAGDAAVLRLSLTNGLFRFQEAIDGVIRNFNNPIIRGILRLVAFPTSSRRPPAPDWVGHQAVKALLRPGEELDRLTRYVYVSRDPSDAAGLLEAAFQKVSDAEPIYQKVRKAVRAGRIKRFLGGDWIADAEKEGVLTGEEAARLREAEALSEKTLAVDHFDYDHHRR